MRISLGSAGVCNDCELSVAVGIIEGEMEGDGRLFNGRQRMNKIQLLIQLNTSSLDARLLGKRERVVVFDTIMVRNIGLAVLVLAAGHNNLLHYGHLLPCDSLRFYL